MSLLWVRTAEGWSVARGGPLAAVGTLLEGSASAGPRGWQLGWQPLAEAWRPRCLPLAWQWSERDDGSGRRGLEAARRCSAGALPEERLHLTPPVQHLERLPVGVRRGSASGQLRRRPRGTRPRRRRPHPTPCAASGWARARPCGAGVQAAVHPRGRTAPPDQQRRVLADPTPAADHDDQAYAGRQRSFERAGVRHGCGPGPPTRGTALADASDSDPDAARGANGEQGDVRACPCRASADAHHRERAEQRRPGLGSEHRP